MKQPENTVEGYEKQAESSLTKKFVDNWTWMVFDV